MGNMGVFEVMYFEKIKFCLILLVLIILNQTKADDDDYNVLHTNGAFEFGYNNPDSYHYAQGNRNNVVKGEFGGRNPKTGGIDTTIYTAGPRGFRPRGKNIVRKYDLNQSGPRPIGSKDDPYYDPYEDPSYNFSFRTRTYNRDENANRVGDVTGKYSYVDDVGERHNVEYIAGKRTGFHVKTPFPDSNPRAYGPLYFRGRGRPIPRGRTSIQRGLDGSYKFVSAGPDQRRTETSDSTGHVRGSYTYLDDKGVQHSVHYIAGPETGYRVLKTVKGPHLPTVFPFNHPDIIPADFYDYNDKDVFDTAATGHARPGARPSTRPGARPSKPDDTTGSTAGDDDGIGDNDFGKVPKPGESRPPSGTSVDFGNKKPNNNKPFEPAFGDNDSGYETDFGDLFEDGGKQGKEGSKKGKSGNGGSGNDYITGGSTASGKPSKPLDGLFNGDVYKDSNLGSKDGSYGSNSSSKPSNEYIPPKGTTSEEQSGEEYGSTGNGLGKPSSGNRKKPSSTRPPTGGSKPVGRPEASSSEENDDFGLFGSETSRPKPTYGNKVSDDRPLITIGGSTKDCPRCQGTVLTNVGDTYLSVPPGVSVRAHVQAVDLLPYSSRFPGPSDQYKADLTLKTEQLNSEKDTIIGEIEDSTEITSDEATTEETTTEIDATTILSSNSTET